MASLKLIARRFPKPRNTEAFGRPKLHAMHGGNESAILARAHESIPLNTLFHQRQLQADAQISWRRSQIKSFPKESYSRRAETESAVAARFPFPNPSPTCTVWSDSDIRTPSSKGKNGPAYQQGPGARLSLPVL